MIEECKNLEQCEVVISQQLQNIKLIGEISLSFEEVLKLETLLKECIKNNSSFDVDFLVKKAPSSLSCYLVWKGILSYHDGKYWGYIKEGLNISYSNWQSRLGEFFINFLRKRGLFVLDIKDSRRYLTPILFHGEIPNSCLKEFFDEVLLRLVNDILFDPSNKEEIKHELLVQREYFKIRENIENQIRDLLRERESVNKELRSIKQILNTYSIIKELRNLQNIIHNQDKLTELPDDYEKWLYIKNQEIKKLTDKLKFLKEQKRIFEEQISNYKKEYEIFIEHETEITKIINNISSLKNELKNLRKLEHKKNVLTQDIKAQIDFLFDNPLNQISEEKILNLNLDKIEAVIKNLKQIDADLQNIKQEIELLHVERNTILKIKNSWILLILFFSGFFIIFFNVVPFINGMIVISIGIALLLVKILKCLKINTLIKNKNKIIYELEKTIKNSQNDFKYLLQDFPIKQNLFSTQYNDIFINLVNLKANVEILNQLNEEQFTAKNLVKRSIAEIKELTNKLSLGNNGSISGLINRLKEKLQEAILQKNEKNKAERELKERITPEINKINSNIQEIYQEIEDIKSKFQEFGNGNLAQGINIVKQRKEAKKRIQFLMKELEDRFPNFTSVEDLLKQSNENKDKLQQKEVQLQTKLKNIEEEINVKNQELYNYPTLFTYVDEPIKRFFIYGAEIAENFLIASVQMLDQVIKDGIIPDKIQLPDRVIEAFKEWWNEKSKVEDRGKPNFSDKFVAPYLYFDSYKYQIFIKFPRQQFEYTDNIKSIDIEIIQLRIKYYRPKHTAAIYVQSLTGDSE